MQCETVLYPVTKNYRYLPQHLIFVSFSLEMAYDTTELYSMAQTLPWWNLIGFFLTLFVLTQRAKPFILF
jgi:hypothetical protein